MFLDEVTRYTRRTVSFYKWVEDKLRFKILCTNDSTNNPNMLTGTLVIIYLALSASLTDAIALLVTQALALRDYLKRP